MSSSTIDSFWGDKAKIQLNYPIESGLLQSRKIRALDLAMRDGPKARRHLDHLDPATDEDYFTVEASLVEQVLQSRPAIELLGISTVRALSSLNRDIRASASLTNLACRRWKFVLKAIELIKDYQGKIPLEGNLFRKLAKFDIEFALEIAEEIYTDRPRLNVLTYIVEGLLEEAVETAQDDLYCLQQDLLSGQTLYKNRKNLSETKQILQKATRIANNLEGYADEARKKIASAYLKVGLIEEALELTKNITLPFVKSSSFANIAAATTDPQACKKIFEEAITVANQPLIDANGDYQARLALATKISSLTYIGIKLAARNPTEAKKMLRRTFEIANSQQDPATRFSLLSDMIQELVECAGELAARGLLDEVTSIIDAISDAEENSLSYAMLTQTLVKAGLPDIATKFIDKIYDTEIETRVLLSITGLLLDMDCKTDAEQFFKKAERLMLMHENLSAALSVPFEQMKKRINPTELPRNSAVVLARAGRHQEALKEAMKITDVSNKIATLSEIASEHTKEDPEAGLAVFNEAIKVAQTLKHQEEKHEAICDVLTLMAMLGFPNIEFAVLNGESLTTQLAERAATLAEVDLEAGQEVFQDAICKLSNSDFRGSKGVVEKLAKVGLSQEKMPDKTLVNYALVSAHYTMEIYKAEQIKDEQKKAQRLAVLALRQAAYHPDIGITACNKISDLQKKTETLTRIAAMRKTVA